MMLRKKPMEMPQDGVSYRRTKLSTILLALMQGAACGCFYSAIGSVSYAANLGFGIPVLLVGTLMTLARLFDGILNGQPVLQGFQPKKLIRTPFVIAIMLGLLLFVTQFKLPIIIMSCMKTIASLNTPLAMFIVGVYLAQTDIRHMFQRKSLYLVSIVRLIVIPVVSLLFLLLLPREYKDMKIVLLLASACPVGANVSMYAQLHQKDYSYAVETVTISTIYSIITMPLFLLAAQHLL